MFYSLKVTYFHRACLVTVCKWRAIAVNIFLISAYTEAGTQNRWLLHKPNWIWALWAKITFIKKSFGLCSPNKYEIDLSNEVLNIDLGQGAAKTPEIKVGVRKRYLPIGLVRTYAPGVSRVGRYFFQTPTLMSGIFAAPWLKPMFSTSFTRSFSYLFGD